MSTSHSQIPSWVSKLTAIELSEAIESTGAMAARLYADGVDTTDVDYRLDELMAEADRRML